MQKISTPQHQRYNNLSGRGHILLLISHFPKRSDNAQSAHLNHTSHKTSTGHKQRPHRDRSVGSLFVIQLITERKPLKPLRSCRGCDGGFFGSYWAVKRPSWAGGVAATATQGATARKTKNTGRHSPGSGQPLPTSAANTPVADNSPFSPSTSHYLTPHD